MSGWGCPHQDQEKCNRLGGLPCDPGMKGCILAGRFRFSNPAKNRSVKSSDGGGATNAPEEEDDSSVQS